MNHKYVIRSVVITMGHNIISDVTYDVLTTNIIKMIDIALYATV